MENKKNIILSCPYCKEKFNPDEYPKLYMDKKADIFTCPHCWMILTIEEFLIVIN